MMPFSKNPNQKLKIVVDTNLFISVFVFRGKMVRTIFKLVIEDKLSMYVSPDLKEELSRKLKFFGVTKKVHDEVMLFIESKGISVDPDINLNILRDEKDNFLLELSEAAKVNYLISRDEDVLIFKKWRGTANIMPEDFLPMLRKLGLLE